MHTEADVQRFMSHVWPSEDGCLVWEGAKIARGYGIFALSKKKHMLAHRFIFEATHGEIPSGLVIDHICNNPSCVLIDHLQAITQKENVLRSNGSAAKYAARTHCGKGHEYTEENTARDNRNARVCIECRRAYSREASRKYRAECGDLYRAASRERYARLKK